MVEIHRRLRPVRLALVALTVALALPAFADDEQSPDTDARITALESRIEALGTTLNQIQRDQKQVLTSLRRIEAQLRSRGSGAPEPPDEPVDIDLGASPAKGDANGPVAIVEFSDFQCPYCSKVQPLLSEVLDAYPNGVKVVFKQFPLDRIHPQARPAAIASLAAHEQGKFWEMHDALFANQRSLSPEFYLETARELGLDMDRFAADLERADLAKRVDEEMEQGRVAGVRGTPTLYVNGIRVTNRSVPGMKAMIDAELEKARSGGRAER